MKQVTILFLALILLHMTPACQSRWQFSLDLGPTFTSDIQYKNSAGHINTVMTVSPAFTYFPISTLGIELKYSGMSKPLSYLDNKTNERVKDYTTSHITLSRFLTGLNFYLPLKNVKPFLGILAGASYAEENDYSPYSHLINFNWGFQMGATLNINSLIALRLDASKIYVQNVPNNSAFFGTAADGGGFPSFIIGNPSKATIKQLNVNFGLILNIGKSKKKRV